MTKHILITLVGVYLVGAWLLPTLGLTQLAPFQFIIAGFLITKAFKLLRWVGILLTLALLAQVLVYFNIITF